MVHYSEGGRGGEDVSEGFMPIGVTLPQTVHCSHDVYLGRQLSMSVTLSGRGFKTLKEGLRDVRQKLDGSQAGTYVLTATTRPPQHPVACV